MYMRVVVRNVLKSFKTEKKSLSKKQKYGQTNWEINNG